MSAVVIVGELVAGAHRKSGRRLSSLGDLLVTQLQLRLQVSPGGPVPKPLDKPSSGRHRQSALKGAGLVHTF